MKYTNFTGPFFDLDAPLSPISPASCVEEDAERSDTLFRGKLFTIEAFAQTNEFTLVSSSSFSKQPCPRVDFQL